MPSSLRTIQVPNFSLKRSSTTPAVYSSGKPALKLDGGSKSTFGNMKRVMAPMVARKDATNVAHAAPSQGKNSRRVSVAAAGAAAAAFASSGSGSEARALTGCSAFSAAAEVASAISRLASAWRGTARVAFATLPLDSRTPRAGSVSGRLGLSDFGRFQLDLR